MMDSQNRGLRNLGHTCFLNSVVQVLVDLPGMSDVLCSGSLLSGLLPPLKALSNSHGKHLLHYKTNLLESLKVLEHGHRGRARSLSAFLDNLLFDLRAETLSPETVKILMTSITERMIELCSSIKSKSNFSDPISLYLGFLCMNPSTLAFHQHDVSEFFNFLVDKMHSECVSSMEHMAQQIHADTSNSYTKRLCRGVSTVSFSPADKSVFSDLFRGSVGVSWKCSACGGSDCSETPFVDLSLQIPHAKIPCVFGNDGFKVTHYTIEDCLSDYVLERFEGERKCPKCGNSGSLDCFNSFREFPPILVINLGRANYRNGKYTKNSTFVDIPEELDLGPFSPEIPKDSRNLSKLYHIQGMIMHQGKGSDAGHYTCYTKPGNFKWVFCNDQNVRDFPENSDFQDLFRSFPTGEACMLFYVSSNFTGFARQNNKSLQEVSSKAFVEDKNVANLDSLDEKLTNRKPKLFESIDQLPQIF